MLEEVRRCYELKIPIYSHRLSEMLFVRAIIGGEIILSKEDAGTPLDDVHSVSDIGISFSKEWFPERIAAVMAAGYLGSEAFYAGFMDRFNRSTCKDKAIQARNDRKIYQAGISCCDRVLTSMNGEIISSTGLRFKRGERSNQIWYGANWQDLKYCILMNIEEQVWLIHQLSPGGSVASLNTRLTDSATGIVQEEPLWTDDRSLDNQIIYWIEALSGHIQALQIGVETV